MSPARTFRVTSKASANIIRSWHRRRARSTPAGCRISPRNMASGRYPICPRLKSSTNSTARSTRRCLPYPRKACRRRHPNRTRSLAPSRRAASGASAHAPSARAFCMISLTRWRRLPEPWPLATCQRTSITASKRRSTTTIMRGLQPTPAKPWLWKLRAASQAPSYPASAWSVVVPKPQPA